MLYALAIFAPLAGALVSGLLGRIIGDKNAMGASIFGMVVAATCGPLAFWQLTQGGAEPGVLELGNWIESGRFHVNWALRYDTLSAVMVAMVTFVSMLIHVYSIGYMGHETRPKYRFFAYLSLFSFSMLMLVTADNLAQLFFGWEGVGLCSYLLIGYWYDRPSACAAAIKAFVVNRIADLPFAVGLALIFFKFGSLEFSTIFPAVASHATDTYRLFDTTFPALEVIAFLLFIGAMGKSAQLGFHVWLPDAMEGPTPVSALIHAATMVTAGVFLMARMSPLMEYAPYALGFVTFIGATTALFAATIGCAQNDIKRVIAYSTCSQLGYMFAAAGIGAYQASMFHLITHAFFKALLFLAAGSVIHAMSDEQDMRKMGGLWRRIPITCMVMWVGSLALAGIFPFAGFYSKDAIIDATFAAGTPIGYYAWVCTILAAVLTGFYSWRLLFLTFHGKPRASAQVMAHVHESPAVMLLPLVVLAIGALVAGFGLEDSFLQAAKAAFWRGSIFTLPGNQVLVQMEIVEHEIPWLPLAPTAAGVLGILVAFVMYVLNPLLPVRMAQVFGPIYRLFLNKWYFDEFYDRFLVQPLIRLSRILWQVGDATLIDGVPNGLAELTSDGSRQIVKIQTGSLAVYAFAMLIGVVVLVAIFMLSR
jgi:NADH-quinone oxidoreductase subunit L